MLEDLPLILKWYFAIFSIGFIFLPVTFFLFSNFLDKGYALSKIVGITFISYVVFILNVFKIIKFDQISIYLILSFFLIANLLIYKKIARKKLFSNWKIFLFEEILFIGTLFVWVFVRGFNPDIHGLEKFMDFGFINSILRSDYQPAPDMWLAPFKINYYYYGHFITALLTKLSQIPSNYTYNLMVATIFSLSFTSLFSLGFNLLAKNRFIKKIFAAGLLTAIITTLSGNLHTLYSLFLGYSAINSVPFWNLVFSPQTFPNNYWYPNATRFVPFTIHEFPLYSFVVSDLHAHLLDVPFVILLIILSFLIFKTKLKYILIIFSSLIIAIMYMTNAWDALIYAGLFCIVIVIKNITSKSANLLRSLKQVLLFLFLAVILILPFSVNFKPFTSGVGVICAPNFLINIGKIGPFIFEPQHCDRSQLWQLIILYGFFYFFAFSFIWFLLKQGAKKITDSDFFILILIFISSILLIIPEFFYLKDIYPLHYRANTMFKLSYQAFIMLSISSGYIIVRIISTTKNVFFYFICIFLLTLVLSYSNFAINGYYHSKDYKGINGTAYLASLYPEDLKAIDWINMNINGNPVMLEAQGDSYTDFERISANTGLPTILGWGVHEWLWRGTSNILTPRSEDVKTIYEGGLEDTKRIIKKYNVSYIYIGALEFQKYNVSDLSKFGQLATLVYQSKNTFIYKTF